MYHYCCLFSRIQNDVFDSNSNPSLTSSKLAARLVVRRSASDSIGARLRKISFEIGNGRRHSDDLSPDELKNMPQVCFKTGIPVPQTKLNFWLSLSAKQLQNPCSAFLCTRIWVNMPCLACLKSLLSVRQSGWKEIRNTHLVISLGLLGTHNKKRYWRCFILLL